MEGKGVLRERGRGSGGRGRAGNGAGVPKCCGCDRGPGRGYGLGHGTDTLTNRKIRVVVLKSLFTATSSQPRPLAHQRQEAQERETTRRAGSLGAAARGMRRAGASSIPTAGQEHPSIPTATQHQEDGHMLPACWCSLCQPCSEPAHIHMCQQIPAAPSPISEGM